MTMRYLALFAPLLLGGCYGLAGHDEMDRYAKKGELPEWFTSIVGATGSDSQ